MKNRTKPASLAALIAAALLAACGDVGGPSADGEPSSVAQAPGDPTEATVLDTKAAPAQASRVVPGRYIVTFAPAVAEPAAEAPGLVAQAGGTLHFTYTRALRGFAATLPEVAVNALRNNPRIAAIEADQTVSVRQTAQVQATWGLDRVDQRSLPLDTAYRYAGTGTGVTAFVIDTGIRASHVEFRNAVGSPVSRVTGGFTAIADGRGTDDCDGHGTHVAGTFGGLTFGVAKQARLVPVRVLDCAGSGTWSGVIAGIDYVAKSPLRPAVANLSIGGGASSSVDTAVANAVAAGVTVVVAAGNSNVDACTTSPARAPSAITVGATTRADARASFSNFGACLDLFAPGTSITSAVIASDTATAAYSGTSMASPHVAGAAALVLQAAPTLTPAQVWNRVRGIATSGRVASAGTGSQNLLLFTNPDGEQPPIATTVLVAGGSSLGCTTGSTGRCSVTTANIDRRTAMSSNTGARP